MAQKKTVITTIIDDMTGDEIPEDQAELVSFGWNGTLYELDLSKLGAAKIEKFLTPYVEAARKVSSTRGRPKGSGSTGSTRAPSGSGRSSEELQSIRDWATKNGHTVSPRGRIAAPILEAYDKAHAS